GGVFDARRRHHWRGPWRVNGARIWISLCHRLFATDWRNWIHFKPDLGDDGCRALDDVLNIPGIENDLAVGASLGAIHRRRCLYRSIQWRNDIAGFENGIFAWRHPAKATIRHSHWRPDLGRRHRLYPAPLQQRKNHPQRETGAFSTSERTSGQVSHGSGGET